MTPRRVTVVRWAMAIAVATLVACGGPSAPRPKKAGVLLVGLSPDTPPIAYVSGDQLTGLEVDFAHRLGSDLGREVRFVELHFEDLIPALIDRRIDVIMSGMTITNARKFRVAFADPYLKSGLVALVRREDLKRYDSADRILQASGPVGVRRGTTGEKFVTERMPNARVLVYPTSADAALELRQNRIDVFINDAPVVAWLVSANEADLAGMWKPLTTDELAWAFRPDDGQLRAAANAALARWKADGTSKAILGRWLRGWPGLE
jgi:ABC-type amino acid transport substrate-binding protein